MASSSLKPLVEEGVCLFLSVCVGGCYLLEKMTELLCHTVHIVLLSAPDCGTGKKKEKEEEAAH